MSPERKAPEDRICTFCAEPKLRPSRSAVRQHIKDHHPGLSIKDMPPFTGPIPGGDVHVEPSPNGSVAVKVPKPPKTTSVMDDLALDLILERLFPTGIPTSKIRQVLAWIETTKELMS